MINLPPPSLNSLGMVSLPKSRRTLSPIELSPHHLRPDDGSNTMENVQSSFSKGVSNIHKATYNYMNLDNHFLSKEMQKAILIGILAWACF